MLPPREGFELVNAGDRSLRKAFPDNGVIPGDPDVANVQSLTGREGAAVL